MNKLPREGVLTKMAANAMVPGVTSSSSHLIPAGFGPEWVPLFVSDEGPNKITFNIYILLVYHVANA